MQQRPDRVSVLMSASRALWEVPTPRLRHVALSWDADWLHPRFVYESEPSAEERELVSLFGSYLVADFEAHKVRERVDIVPLTTPPELLPGEEWVYLRYEP